MRNVVICSFLSLLCVATVQVRAAVIAFEDFDGGMIGFLGEGWAGRTVQTDSEIFPGFGNYALATSEADAGDSHRQMTTAIDLMGEGVYYMAMLFRCTGVDYQGMKLLETGGSPHQTSILFTNSVHPEGGELEIFYQGAHQFPRTPYSPDKTYLTVMKFICSTASDADSMHLAVYNLTDGDKVPNTEPTTWTLEELGLAFNRSNCDDISLLGKVAQNTQFDNLLVATEWVDVSIMMGNQGITALSPSPADQAVDVARDNTVLSWKAGQAASQHDVYVGTTFDDVNDATGDSAGIYQGRQTETTFALDRLTLSQTYFWRIDEVNETDPESPWKGGVWRFTVEPEGYPVASAHITATASSSDTDERVAANAVNGSGLDGEGNHSADISDMWLSQDSEPNAEWIQLDIDQPLKLAGMHVWNHNSQTEQIDSLGIKEALIEYTADGENWMTFGVVELAKAPGDASYQGDTVPLGGLVVQSLRITARSSWSQLGFKKYGLSEIQLIAMPMAVRQMDPADGATDVSPVAAILGWRAGREAVTHNFYLSTDRQAVIDGTAPMVSLTDNRTMPDLALATTYYWKVNEVNEAETPSVWQGPVQSFTTAESIVVDDMESYRNTDGQKIWQTWADGFDILDNGSVVGNGNDGTPETDTVFEGNQSLPMQYGVSGAGNSHATWTFAAAQDWSLYGIQSLSLYVHGAADNTLGAFYILVNDTRYTYQGAPEDLKTGAWVPFTIDLGGVTTVTSLTLGMTGGEGKIYVDNIRLFPMQSEVLTAIVPDDSGLQAHYPFEGNANDVSGKGHNGTINGNVQFVAGREGQAADCDGIDAYIATDASASDLGIGGNNARTVSAWVSTRGFNGGGIYDLGNLSAGQDFSLRTLTDTDQWRVQYWGGDFDFPLDSQDKWVHFTHVHDGTHTKIYANGVLIVDWETTIDTPDTNPLQMGLWRTSYFDGLIDELRIYNRPLSQPEAMGLAGRTDPLYKGY